MAASLLKISGCKTRNDNQPQGIDLSLALHKQFLDSHDRRLKDF